MTTTKNSSINIALLLFIIATSSFENCAAAQESGRLFLLPGEKVFDIINALPKQPIFANRNELDSYLEAMQDGCSDYRMDHFAAQSEFLLVGQP